MPRLPPRTSRTAISASALAAEVVMPRTSRLGVQARFFLSITAFFLLLALPLALLGSAALRVSIYRDYAERSLRESRVLASDPVLVAAYALPRPSSVIGPMAERLRGLLSADYVTVTDRQARRLAHPDPALIGQTMVGGDLTSFRQGKTVTETVQGTLGVSVRAKVPVYRSGQVVGLVSVGFLLPRLRQLFWEVVRGSAPWYLLTLLLALLGAHLLSLQVRQGMLGLEPEQIAGVAAQYRTVLHALEEGVMVLRGEEVQLLSPQAARLLGAQGLPLPLPLSDLLPEPAREALLHLRSVPQAPPLALTLGERPVLLSAAELPDGGGWIVTWRDRERVQALTGELSQARQYAELLRAQTHEFSNRLHTLAGLLHLGETEAALESIYSSTTSSAEALAAVLPLRNVSLAGLVIGKYARARELHLGFSLDPLSALTPELSPALSPAMLSAAALAVGNLVENAFEALSQREDARGGEVRLLIAADPDGLEIEVRDDGPGVPPELLARMFSRGASSRGEHRGLGLALVNEAALALGGALTYHRDLYHALPTRFTFALPFLPDAATEPERAGLCPGPT
ncbi:ATP-binding protein [Deinococcus altitudinis]|uniref:sensor histidine kinase n=1 Tax=Deinococcus altitudinis TaxID=468914 RepID=UPI0038926148